MNEDEHSKLNPNAAIPYAKWAYNPLVLVAVILVAALYILLCIGITWDIYFAGDPDNLRGEREGVGCPAVTIFGVWLEFLLFRRLGRRLRGMFRRG